MPGINLGDRFEDFFAREWQNLVRVVEKMSRIQVQTPTGPVQLVDVGSTIRLDFDESVSPVPAGDRRVALVKGVQAIDTTLRVREVVYKVEGPPVEGEYAWGGQPFEAFADIGSRLTDFDSFFFPFDDPTIDTQILTARHEVPYWFVEMPAQQERAVVMRAMFPPEDGSDPRGSRFAIVQEVVPSLSVGGVWTGGFDAVGEPAVVNVWPTMVAGDFEPFIWTAAELNDRTTILPLVMYRGVWFLKQRPKRAVSRRQGPVKVLDCAPAS